MKSLITVAIVMYTINGDGSSWNSREQVVYSHSSVTAFNLCRVVGERWLRDKERKPSDPEKRDYYGFRCEMAAD